MSNKKIHTNHCFKCSSLETEFIFTTKIEIEECQ